MTLGPPRKTTLLSHLAAISYLRSILTELSNLTHGIEQTTAIGLVAFNTSYSATIPTIIGRTLCCTLVEQSSSPERLFELSIIEFGAQERMLKDIRVAIHWNKICNVGGDVVY